MSGITSPRKLRKPLFFNRSELGQILATYSSRVACGEWRDYAISDGQQTADFDIFRRSSEVPLYRVEKIPALHRKQGQYALRGMDGRVLRRGHDLPALLRFFERKNLTIV